MQTGYFLDPETDKEDIPQTKDIVLL